MKFVLQTKQKFSFFTIWLLGRTIQFFENLEIFPNVYIKEQEKNIYI